MLGIGVATAAFSEMNGFIMRDVPGVAKPDELVALKAPVAYETYRRIREQGALFSETLAYAAPVAFGVSVGGRSERIWGHLSTSSYFATLGVRPALGRFFGDEEAAVAVVSGRLWRERLGSDAAIVGKALRVNGHVCTVIGVAPEEFHGASPLMYGADLWLPLTWGSQIAPEMADGVLARYESKILHVVARLRPGVTPARAEAALDAEVRQEEQDHGDPDRDRKGRRAALGQGGKLIPVEKKDVPLLSSFFAVLGGLILLIASSNVANMMLARAAGRRKEIAMRLALGAGRPRLVRQLLIENMLVAASAGALGFLFAAWLMRLASRMPFPSPMPLHFDLSPDGRVALFCLGLTCFTGFAFGLIPALQATRTDAHARAQRGRQSAAGKAAGLQHAKRADGVAGRGVARVAADHGLSGHRPPADDGDERRVRSVAALAAVARSDSRRILAGAGPRDVLEKVVERAEGLPSVTSASLADAVPMTMIGKPATPYTALGNGTKEMHTARRYGSRQGVLRDDGDSDRAGARISKGR